MFSVKTKRDTVMERYCVLVVLSLFPVVVVTSAEFELVHRSECPESCYCDRHRRFISCDDSSLTRLPLHTPITARYYSAAGNHIRHVSPNNLFGLNNLVSLDLADNFISELPSNLFNSTPNLRILRLSNNYFDYIPEASLSRLHNLEQLFMNMNRIRSMSADAEFGSDSLIWLDLTKNEIATIQHGFLDSFPRLRNLLLSKNRLISLEVKKWTVREHQLEILDVSYNNISRIVLNDALYSKLKVLNASHNLFRFVDSSWFAAMPDLSVLDLCGNPISSVANNTFIFATSLKRLVLCQLPNIQHIYSNSFAGLLSLEQLDLSNNYNLSSIQRDAFSSLHRLQYLNVRNNGLRTLRLSNLKVRTVYLAGRRWACDCQLKWIYNAHVTQGSDVGQDIVCSAPPQLHSIALFDVKEFEFPCETTEQHRIDHVVTGHISTSIMLHCPVEVDPQSQIVWTTNRGIVIRSVMVSRSSQLLEFVLIHRRDAANSNTSEKLADGHEVADHFSLLVNGSLIVNDVTRADTGRYTCTVASRHENVTRVTELRLDYSYMSSVMLISLVVGGSCAFAFLLIAVVMGTIRHVVHSCNAAERKKRRSLRELLSQMRNNSQFDRLSAYRAAQLDKLSAFKSATMDQLSAFTSSRIGRLRRYKQATVSCVLNHLERMREHYSGQMDHIKESYRQNTSRLRHSYTTRFRDGRSTSVRKQYRASVARARDYTNQQIARLRDQYKQQQQYLLKLLELIDVGSCVSSSVEEECIRAESAIFDATVELDEEARPSYASRCDDRALFASCTSLPDDRHHCTLNPSVDDDDVSDGDVGMTLRTASAPSVRSCNLVTPTENSRPLKLHTCVATVSYHKTSSTPIVCTLLTDNADVKLTNAQNKN